MAYKLSGKEGSGHQQVSGYSKMNTSSSLLFTALLAAALFNACHALTGRAMEMAAEVDAKCRTETGAGTQSFGLFVQGVVDESRDDSKFKLDHQGTFNLEEELKNVPPEVQEEGHRIVHACQDTQGDDPCDTAFRIHKCYHNTNPEPQLELPDTLEAPSITSTKNRSRTISTAVHHADISCRFVSIRAGDLGLKIEDQVSGQNT
uniref:Uncharacterized protein n=1 Tax=Timema poppense TaxID=170557 RepID=A0A7R9DI33_TIMPO|nr:unnamed protein product [Timema poppensis]